jgi:DNA-binding NarL/FixJ family response regulator
MAMMTKQTSAVRVALISGNYLARVGLKQLIENQVRITLVGESYGGIHACGLVQKYRPDWLVIDLESESNIVEAVSSYKQISPQTKILLLSGWSEIDRAREALGAGAEGMVLKCQPPSVLVAMISGEAGAAAGTGMTTTGVILKEVLGKEGAKRDPEQGARGTDLLTSRERAVVRLVGQGHSNRDIADTLSISETTVRHHLTSIFDKMGVSNRQKLLIRAHQDGLVELTASA